MSNRAPRNDGSGLSAAQIDALRGKIKGKVIVKGEAPDDVYRPLLQRWNRMHIKEANIIVLVESEEDVSETIKFVAEHHLDVAICAGGHTYSGPSSGRGLVIDLRNMRKVSIDIGKKVAVAQGGCKAVDVEKAAEDFKMRAVFGAVNDTGCGGITTGGGFGNLSGQYGLVCDNLVAARVALADGRVVAASETENSDLFWGIRGGGSNFGLVTEFTYKLHDCDHDVFFGVYLFGPDKTEQVLDLFNVLHQDYVLKSNGKFGVVGVFSAMGPVIVPAFAVYYDGSEEEAQKYIQPLLDLGPMAPPGHPIGGKMMRHSATTDFAHMAAMFPPEFSRIAGSSTQVDFPVSKDVLKKTLEVFQAKIAKYPQNLHVSKLLFDLRDCSKIASVPSDATAYAGRRTGLLIAADLMWDDPKLDGEILLEARDLIATVRQAIKDSNEQTGIADVGAHVGATTLYALISDGEEKLVSVFGKNLPRMKRLKAKYDPNVMWDKWYPVEPDHEAV
ncbi:hypothetical protein DRE_05427 [Drechslerella stenobrocha 248]|uniref:FAD-binding PCMH-type domain-containing protein n=1 Tax=Drechslerella stenobrocha 248 TaxID=1043628 RepID=W7HQX2_9PEZI|nr:hypothetical protein DRE_05427 [Drechslerella stenobrocha 248]